MKKIMTPSVIHHYIKKYKLDEVLPEDVLMQGHIVQYQKGDVLLHSGDELDHFCFFLEGKIKILSILENGKSLLLRFYTELDTLGDIELFFPGPADSSVEAVSESYLLKVPMHIIREDYLDDPVFLKYLGHSLSDKLKSISRNSAYNLYYPLVNRLSSYIYEHMNDDNQVLFYSSYMEISEFLGTTYRHLNRTLNELADMGIIKVHGKNIEVLDLDALKALAKNLYR